MFAYRDLAAEEMHQLKKLDQHLNFGCFSLDIVHKNAPLLIILRINFKSVILSHPDTLRNYVY